MGFTGICREFIGIIQGLYGINLSPKVIIWEPLWALSIYYIPTLNPNP